MSEFTLSAFADEISAHLDEQISVLQLHDIAFVEFRNLEGKVIIDYSPAEIKEIANRLSSEGIGVSAVGSPIGKIKITDPFEPHLERFRKTIETAHLLRTNYIRMFSFFIPQGEAPDKYRAEVIRRWLAFVEVSAGSGLTLLHENEKEIYGDSAERCLDLLETMASPRVKATFDPANFIQCGVETYPHAFQLLEKRIEYVHIKDAIQASGEVVPAGLGDGRILEILKRLKTKDYSGFLSLEPHLNNSLPGGGPENFTRAVQALRGLLAKI